jgi:hypothetical protein
VMLAQAPDLGSLDFSLHLDSGPAVSAQDAPAPPADPFVPQLGGRPVRALRRLDG